MDCSTPHLPVHYQLPEFTQTHVCEAIQQSPLSFPSPAFKFSHHQDFFSDSALRISWPKNWHFSFSISPSNEYSGLIFFRIYWIDIHVVQGTLKNILQSYSSKVSSVFSFLYGPTLTSLHDYWKNHSFDGMDLC